MKKKVIAALVSLVLLCVVGVGILIGGGWWYAHRPLDFATPVIEFNLPKGAGMRQAANVIAAAGLDVDPRLLTWIARVGRSPDLPLASPYEAIFILSHGAMGRANFRAPSPSIIVRSTVISAIGAQRDSESSESTRAFYHF
ncbi:hypothetical protein AGMMS50225_05370 [Betaproteobacteria bacterium]|nr:hypothetical protein AGMMS50225_05370 [Betaproteobacteria bacterium]